MTDTTETAGWKLLLQEHGAQRERFTTLVRIWKRSNDDHDPFEDADKVAEYWRLEGISWGFHTKASYSMLGTMAIVVCLAFFRKEDDPVPSVHLLYVFGVGALLTAYFYVKEVLASRLAGPNDREATERANKFYTSHKRAAELFNCSIFELAMSKESELWNLATARLVELASTVLRFQAVLAPDVGTTAWLRSVNERSKQFRSAYSVLKAIGLVKKKGGHEYYYNLAKEKLKAAA